MKQKGLCARDRGELGLWPGMMSIHKKAQCCATLGLEDLSAGTLLNNEIVKYMQE